VERCEEEEERMFLLKELLRRLPKANLDNITALFRLLNKLGTVHCSGDCPRLTRTLLLLFSGYSTS
jgi:hypothetical protein